MIKKITKLRSQKGKDKIFENDFIYNQDKIYENFISWRYVRRDCSGRMHTDLISENVLKFQGHHHEKEIKRLVRFNLNNKLKYSALNTGEGFIDVFTKEVVQLNKEEKIHIGNFDSLRDYFVRNRANSSKIQENVSRLLDSHKFTYDGKKILYHECLDDDSQGFHIFTTENNISLLEKSNVWLADGTFYASPKNYTQVYIIHCLSFGKIFSTIYILMKTKTQKSYVSAFEKIKKLINKQPITMIIDYEIAVYNAISKVFNNVKISGCNFHFNQITTRFMIENKIIDVYRTNEHFRKYVKYLLILAYLPPAVVKNEFKKITEMKLNSFPYISILAFSNSISLKPIAYIRV
ncbi:hypothetical protein DMUE_5772 [Dictyocoela muelleri]|nr:hypothetical protein DMUE_5772 [Dictyocoela muelleri]